MVATNIALFVTSYGAIILALIAVAVSVYTYNATSKEDTYKYLAGMWDDILNTSLQYPSFLNPTVTAHYDSVMNDEDRSRYDAFCYKVWGCIEDMVVKGFHKDPQFNAIIHWTTAYHLLWLQLNPTFFTIEEFWKIIEKMENDPQLVIQYRPLPTASDGDIDWDLVCPEYHRYILSPFAPEMVAPDENGVIRNTLVSDIIAGRFGPLDGLHAADFGCGPGNLIAHLPDSLGSLTGVDKSQRALELASNMAEQRGMVFNSHSEDLGKLDLEQRFDVIFCINAVLPGSREEVTRILGCIRDHLTDDGRLVAILPIL